MKAVFDVAVSMGALARGARAHKSKFICEDAAQFIRIMPFHGIYLLVLCCNQLALNPAARSRLAFSKLPPALGLTEGKRVCRNDQQRNDEDTFHLNNLFMRWGGSSYVLLRHNYYSPKII